MDIFIMYILMIIDLAWTLMHHEEAGELNPLFVRLLDDKEITFVYIKLAANTLVAIVVIYLRHKRPWLSRGLAILGIIVYGVVVYLHWFVDHSLRYAEKLDQSRLWELMAK
ncbi:hypothetical protein KAU08_00435 [bacterium]|nr:hypothetical protein [bacterium]